MEFLDYIRLFTTKDAANSAELLPVSINLITNFTDDSIAKTLGGMCISEGYYPTITQAPYKQYHFVLKDASNPLVAAAPNISFIFFDINPYLRNEFNASAQHSEDTLADIRTYCKGVSGVVVANLCLIPYQSTHGHAFTEDALFKTVQHWNEALLALSKELSNLHVYDPNILIHRLGEKHSRDSRGSYAYDIPFTNEFIVALTREWVVYIRAITGRTRKCLVLDLDNTLWGGVVGEVGPRGIALGPTYPGVAFQNFQHALLTLWERGVILAISSKNNSEDVEEVFEQNPYMLLKKEHFAAIRTNWDEKSVNIDSIATELNIGTDSMVFLDDSPLEREKMRLAKSEVLVPEFSIPPEEYVHALLTLNVFHQISTTEEDKARGKMYAQERQRKEAGASFSSKAEYLASLGITLTIQEGAACDIARIAQLTQKTNQCTITTKRYTESDITSMIQNEWGVYSAEVADKFGGYGIVIVALVNIQGSDASLDTFLMSCRVMGRDVEFDFLNQLYLRLKTKGVETLFASFAPTKKNTPAADFLPNAGFILIEDTPVLQTYRIALS